LKCKNIDLYFFSIVIFVCKIFIVV
jgi:hypothetical protein